MGSRSSSSSQALGRRQPLEPPLAIRRPTLQRVQVTRINDIPCIRSLDTLAIHTYHIGLSPQTNAFAHATSPARFIGVRQPPSPDSLAPSPAHGQFAAHACTTILGWQCHAHASIQEQQHKKRNCHARQPGAVPSINSLDRSDLLVSRQRPAGFQEWLTSWP